MDNLKFDVEEFKETIADLVPPHQAGKVMAALNLEEATEADFDRIGTSLTGEQVTTGFLFLTSTGKASSNSLWSAIKAETYDLFCTSSKKYSNERKDGMQTIRNTILVLATAVAGSLHLALGVVTGAVTIMLMCLLKISRNAWCAINQPNAAVATE